MNYSNRKSKINNLRFARNFKKLDINWEKYLSRKDIKRNQWLVQEWFKLYIQNPEELGPKKLNTEDLHSGIWLKKYGLEEPDFSD